MYTGVHSALVISLAYASVAGVADENAGGQGSEVVAMQWPISRADFNLDQHIEAVTKMHLRAGPEVE
jgi:hypothetical protein